MSLWHHVICPRSITRRDQSINNFQLHPQLPLHAHECAHVCMHTSSTYIFPSRYQKKKVSVPAWGYLRFIKSLVTGEHGRQDRKGLIFSVTLFGRCAMRQWLFSCFPSLLASWFCQVRHHTRSHLPVVFALKKKTQFSDYAAIVPESSGFLRTGCEWAPDTKFCGLCQSLLFMELKHFAFFLMKTPYNQWLLLEHSQHWRQEVSVAVGIR